MGINKLKKFLFSCIQCIGFNSRLLVLGYI